MPPVKIRKTSDRVCDTLAVMIIIADLPLRMCSMSVNENNDGEMLTAMPNDAVITFFNGV